ncbi:cysteine hydrolase [Cellulomonas fimi]|uniref:isochorismatase family protein n=1 Tax=Cellulomonas fimi TaxID=1708 RepID=UPI00234D3006|nr:isochorismatase family protein [Cellulomonas fimi]MDC7122936.1 cysteine hydrolase [Cellulomonas fimi]
MHHHVSGTTPYPWPYDGDLSGPGTALLVVLPSEDGLPGPVDAQVRALGAAMRSAGGSVLLVRAAAPSVVAPDDAATPAGTTPPDDLADVALDAGGIDAFYASDLDLVLRTRGVRRLVLAGVGLETCVHSTMRDANDRGYECLLVVDACVPVDPDLVAAAVSSVEMSGGIFGAVGRTAAVVAALTTVPVSPVPTSGALS